VFCGREPTKTVPVHGTHAGDHEAGADDVCVNTGEWGEEAGRWRRLKPNNCGCLSSYGRAGTQPMTLDQLRAGGIDFPAVVIGELELNGYVIERVYEQGKLLGVRLLENEAPDPPATRRRHRWRRQHSG